MASNVAHAHEPAPAAPRCPIDHAHLARYTFGNRALEIEVLGLFVDQAPDYVAALRSAASDKAWCDAAHTLKGSARAVGANRLAACAERAEALRQSNDRAQRDAAVAGLAQALDEVCAHIARLGAHA